MVVEVNQSFLFGLMPLISSDADSFAAETGLYAVKVCLLSGFRPSRHFKLAPFAICYRSVCCLDFAVW